MRRPGPPKRSTIISALVVVLLAIGVERDLVYVVIKLGVFDPSLSEQIGHDGKVDDAW